MKVLITICLLLAFFLAVPIAYAGEGDFDGVRIQHTKLSTNSDTTIFTIDNIITMSICAGLFLLAIATIIFISGGNGGIVACIGVGFIIIPLLVGIWLIYLIGVVVFFLIIGITGSALNSLFK
ncbi:MAG: hypothetical protein KKB03_04260 [Nanoarchaeota archaeon]|nr:hypothetical protein [Nanoarchaeota archaeon]MBU1135775.1 hypothetical protein [Nanoarchaeota archaeon]MBU2520427.1 hypothetical protein [Nanoarchaeota archaeon]